MTNMPIYDDDEEDEEASALADAAMPPPTVRATVVPATRSIEEVVAALVIVRDELLFHVARLKQTIPREGEGKRLRHLILDYLRAEQTLGRLYGYQMTRLERRNVHGTTSPEAVMQDSTIDARGVAGAVVDEHHENDDANNRNP